MSSVSSSVPLNSTRSAAAETAYNAIVNRIFSGSIQSGSKITVDRLVRDLDLSQTPIREALARLEAEGLVTKTHLVGYRAAPQMGADQVRDLYDLRLLLEPYGAHQAAMFTGGKELMSIKSLADDMHALQESGESSLDFARKDALFHVAVAAASGNALLASTVSGLQLHVQLFRLRNDRKMTVRAVEEHARIVQAIQSGNAELAEVAMKEHLLASRQRVQRVFETQREG